LPKEISDQAFSELERTLENIIHFQYSEGQLVRAIDTAELPEPHRNMLYVIGAEEARRNKWYELSQQFVGNLTNPILRQVWEMWETRFSSPTAHI